MDDARPRAASAGRGGGGGSAGPAAAVEAAGDQAGALEAGTGFSAVVLGATGDATESGSPGSIRTAENSGSGADGPVDKGSLGGMLTPASAISTAGADSRDSPLPTSGKDCI